MDLIIFLLIKNLPQGKNPQLKASYLHRNFGQKSMIKGCLFTWKLQSIIHHEILCFEQNIHNNETGFFSSYGRALLECKCIRLKLYLQVAMQSFMINILTSDGLAFLSPWLIFESVSLVFEQPRSKLETSRLAFLSKIDFDGLAFLSPQNLSKYPHEKLISFILLINMYSWSLITQLVATQI